MDDCIMKKLQKYEDKIEYKDKKKTNNSKISYI